MKVDVFKKLIKEAVREVVREELPTLLSENLKQGNLVKPVVTQVTTYENYKPVTKKPVKTGDPIMDILNETRASMTQETYRDLVSASPGIVEAPGLGMNFTSDQQTTPQVGLDLSALGFVKNAGAVYKASVEKDKVRFGA